MRSTIYSLALAVSISACQADDSSLLQAMIQVESRSRDDAKGDNGKAAGCLQIHAVMVADVNRLSGTSYTWPTDCFDRAKSSEMWRAYMDAYCKGASDEVKARRWNGGPKGDAKPATLGYWAKVKALLSK